MRRRVCAVHSVRDYSDLDKVASPGLFILTDGAPGAVNLSALKIKARRFADSLDLRAPEMLGFGRWRSIYDRFRGLWLKRTTASARVVSDNFQSRQPLG